MFVQLVQIARAVTTYESMRGHANESTHAAEAITLALTAGSTSMDGGQLNDAGMGPNPALSGAHPLHRRKEGYFATWQKLLGLDTFVATATGTVERGQGRRRGNPFSRGLITNCQDFWCDPAPYFGKRENGAALLCGDAINYARMYERPPRMNFRRSEQAMYHSVDNDDAV